MKMPKIPVAAATMGGLITAFWLYGMARTMQETVHFDLGASLNGLLFGVCLPLLFVLPCWFVAKEFGLRRRFPFYVIMVSLCLLAGSLASEAWIVWDEAEFSAEVSKRNKDVPYSRARVWPNQGCSLVFVPGKGIHSTD